MKEQVDGTPRGLGCESLNFPDTRPTQVLNPLAAFKTKYITHCDNVSRNDCIRTNVSDVQKVEKLCE